MPDITFPARRLRDLSMAVGSVFTLQPPPTPKGRYYFAKVAEAIAREVPLYEKSLIETMRDHAEKDASGEPKLTQEQTPTGVLVKAEKIVDLAAYQKAVADLESATVTLAGLRPITHAELGSCPIPVGAYGAMLGTIIEDKEPE